jgi:hypothetical protein
MDETKAHPLLELRFAYRQEFARTLQVNVTREIVDSGKLTFYGISHGAHQHVIWNFEAQH